MLNFRFYHTLQILSLYDKSNLPLDSLIRDYLKNNKAIGSKDRNHICKNIYFLIRNLSLIDAFLSSPITWEKRLNFLPLITSQETKDLPVHIKYSCPKWLFDLLSASMNQESLNNFLITSLTEAPLTIRVNEAKADRDFITELLKKKYDIVLCQQAASGVKFTKREPLTSDPLFKDGFFEIQDEASQLACQRVKASPGDHILDYCAGAGGKALAIAPCLKGKGTIYLHDIRAHAIKEAKKRFERAGIQNVQYFDSTKPLPDSLIQKMDWVIVDVPCTGTGTFRRNPDLKWKLKKENIPSLIAEQKAIFAQAIRFVKPKGFIMYATCSVLKQENEDQINDFLKTYPLKREGQDLALLPQLNSHDGFFASILQLDDKGIK